MIVQQLAMGDKSCSSTIKLATSNGKRTHLSQHLLKSLLLDHNSGQQEQHNLVFRDYSRNRLLIPALTLT